jgi:hypothetical protein
MKRKEGINDQQEFPEERAIFASKDEIQRIEQVIENLETVHRELLKVAEDMKLIID